MTASAHQQIQEPRCCSQCGDMVTLCAACRQDWPCDYDRLRQAAWPFAEWFRYEFTYCPVCRLEYADGHTPECLFHVFWQALDGAPITPPCRVGEGDGA